MMKTLLIILICFFLGEGKNFVYGEVFPERKNGMSRLEGYMEKGDESSVFLIKRGIMNTTLGRKEVENGRFVLEADLDRPSFLLVSIPPKVSTVVRLLPGQTSSIRVDGTRVIFSGAGQEINNMLVELDRKYTSRYPGYSRNPILDDSRSELLCDIFWEQAAEISQSHLSERDKKLVIGYLQGDLLTRLYSQIVMSKIFGKSFPKPDIREGYAKQVQDMELLPEIQNNSQWLDGVQEILYDRLKIGKIKVNSWETRIVDMAMGLKDLALQREYMLSTLENEVMQGTLTGIRDRMAAVKPFLRRPEELQRLEKLETQLDGKMQRYEKALPGTDFSRFGFRNEQGDSVFFADFKGKYVFVDLWSTGCNPCVGEIPYIREMESRFAGQPLVWVSISMDLNEKTWKDFLEKREMKGIQLICEKGFKHPFCEQIALSGIPRFLLLDREGCVVDCNTLRPSNPVLSELLEIQLKKK